MAKSAQKKTVRKTSGSKGARPDGYVGLLVIGDPHVEGRQPGFRKDDFPNVILKKIAWCLDYAKSNQLLPTFLGDMFDKPRDNPTWMIGRLIEIMSGSGSIGIYGNHDCAEPELNDNDSLSILLKSGCLRLVDRRSPWRGVMNDRPVFVGGSSYRQPIPEEFKVPATGRRSLFDSDPFVVWLTHHDIDIAGYENGRFKPYEIENVDLLINGHIHRRLESVQAGQTVWMTPGNISRRSRSEANRQHVPTVVRIDVQSDGHKISDVVVPHEDHTTVFYDSATDIEKTEEGLAASEFVTGLAELTARRTDSSAGLHEFLAANISQFESEVVVEIERLAELVTESGES